MNPALSFTLLPPSSSYVSHVSAIYQSLSFCLSASVVHHAAARVFFKKAAADMLPVKSANIPGWEYPNAWLWHTQVRHYTLWPLQFHEGVMTSR
jgi:hypothetical protein